MPRREEKQRVVGFLTDEGASRGEEHPIIQGAQPVVPVPRARKNGCYIGENKGNVKRTTA